MWCVDEDSFIAASTLVAPSIIESYLPHLFSAQSGQGLSLRDYVLNKWPLNAQGLPPAVVRTLVGVELVVVVALLRPRQLGSAAEAVLVV